MCGEKAFWICGKKCQRGSPPRVRGKVLCMVKQPEMERDHPRVCGEKLSSAIAEAMPPRITPACAGKSKRRGGALALEEDHPRVCGEKLLCRITYGSPQGSPPRVRGKEEIIGIPANIVRITPACAGKSASLPKRINGEGDHPRVCGEKTKKSP